MRTPGMFRRDDGWWKVIGWTGAFIVSGLCWYYTLRWIF